MDFEEAREEILQARDVQQQGEGRELQGEKATCRYCRPFSAALSSSDEQDW